MHAFAPYVIRSADKQAETVAFLARVTSPMPVSVAGAYDRFIKSLKSCGVWAKCDAIWRFGGPDQQSSLLNLKSSSFTATLAGTPPPTFSSTFGGFAGDGTQSYIDTGYQPTGVAGRQYVLNSAEVNFYSRSNLQSSGYAFGARSGANTLLGCIRNGSNLCVARINDATPSTMGGVTDSRGLFSFCRPSSTIKQLFKNAVQVGSVEIGSTSVPGAGNIFALTSNGSAIYWPGEVSFMSVGAYLEAGERSGLLSAILQFDAEVGAS